MDRTLQVIQKAYLYECDAKDNMHHERAMKHGSDLAMKVLAVLKKFTNLTQHIFFFLNKQLINVFITV